MEPGDTDLIKQNKELYDRWSNAYADMMKDFMQTPAFKSWLGSTLNQNLELRKQMQEAMQENLRTLGVPTKVDMDSVYDSVHDLSLRINDLSATINELKKEIKKKKKA
jgi:regulator of replication initiation timing